MPFTTCPTCNQSKLDGYKCFHGCDDWAEMERERYDEPDDDVRELLEVAGMSITHDERGRPIVARADTVPQVWNHGFQPRSCTCKSGSPTCPTCTEAIEDEARGYL